MNASAWFWLASAYVAWIVLASAIAVGLIAWDKRQARLGKWRTPEATLHLWELLGGWPGAIWARHRFRHKTAKRSYVWRARLMAVLHIGTVVLIALALQSQLVSR